MVCTAGVPCGECAAGGNSLRSVPGPSPKTLQRSEMQFQDIPCGGGGLGIDGAGADLERFLSSVLGGLSKRPLLEIMYPYIHEHISRASIVD